MRLRTNAGDGITPIGIAGVRDSANLKNIGRPGDQALNQSSRTRIPDRLDGPGIRCLLGTGGRPAQLIAVRLSYGYKRDQQFAAVTAGNNLAYGFR